MKIILIVLAIMQLSCSQNRFLGEYSSRKSPHSFLLSQDSTFIYEYKLGTRYLYSNGTWQKLGPNRLQITSKFQSTVIPIELQQINNDIASGITTLEVSTNLKSEKEQYYRCLVLIDDHVQVVKRCDSFKVFQIPTPQKSIVFGITADERIPGRFLDTVMSTKYMFDKSAPSKIVATWYYNDSFFSYKVFSGHTLRITNKRLHYQGDRLPLIKN